MVLDFGGNAGNLLRDDNCTICPENYYCIDVIQEALDEGRRRFPQAHWVHYNRYNCSLNPEGDRDLPVPDLGIEFDVMLAYSVFTHTTREEMHDLVEHWKHIRTTNPIESTIASVRLGTTKTKGCLSRMTAFTMVFRLCQSASKKWRRLDGSNQIAEIIQSVKIKDGEKLAERAA